jgi:hypothetical protein
MKPAGTAVDFAAGFLPLLASRADSFFNRINEPDELSPTKLLVYLKALTTELDVHSFLFTRSHKKSASIVVE